MASFYKLDSEIRQMLTLDNLLGELTVPEFVNKISSKTPVSFKKDEASGVQYIDSKPYIRNFEAVLRELQNLGVECESRKSKLDKDASEYQAQHNDNINQLSSKASKLTVRLDNLSTNVSRIHSNSINPLGERLKKTNKVKENSLSLIFLTRSYNTFYTESRTPRDLTNYTSNQMESVARAWNQLLFMSSKLALDPSLKKAKETDELIISEANKFEADILKAFQKYEKVPDPRRLKELTHILFIYNDGVKLVSSFVENHRLAAEYDPLDPITEEYWVPLGNPENSDFKLDRTTLLLFTSAITETKSRFDEIQNIFQEHTTTVLRKLFSDFYQIISQRVEYLLKMTTSYSKLAYLRTLHLLFVEATHVTKSVKPFLKSKGIDLGIELDRLTATVFAGYISNDLYINDEKASLADIIEFLTAKFELQNEKIIAKHLLANRIAQFREQHSTDGTTIAASAAIDNDDTQSIFSTTASYAPSATNNNQGQQTRRLLSYGRKGGKKLPQFSKFIKSMDRSSSIREKFKRHSNPSLRGNGSVTDLASLAQTQSHNDTENEMTLEVTEDILKAAVESLTRCNDLVPANRINDYVVDLFEQLLYYIGPSYISIGLESLYNEVQTQQKQQSSLFGGNTDRVDLSYLKQLDLVPYQLYLFSITVKSFYFPIFTSQQLKQRILSTFNSFLSDVEIGVNIILDSSLALFERAISSILNTQQYNDFNTTDLSMFDKTSTCTKLTEFMETTFKTIDSTLLDNTLLKYELVCRLSGTLLESLIHHFMKFIVSSIGSSIVTEDMIHYINTFQSFTFINPVENELSGDITFSSAENELKDSFNILKELTNLFSCQPEMLKELANEGQLQYLRRVIIKGYIRRRSDFKEKYLIGI